MLEANKSKWFEKLFSIYNRNLIRRRFCSLNVEGLDNLKNRNKTIPTIIYANHSSWWDGLITFEIARKVSADFYVLMEEKQLRELPLFRKLGAFSVIRENPRKAIQSINYAAKLLAEKQNAALCLFPQGEILPNDQRPIEFFNGISRIIGKLDQCQTFCIAMRFEFLGDFKPEIFIKIDKINSLSIDSDFDSKKHTEHLAHKLEDNLNKLKSLILLDDTDNFEDIFK